MYFTIVPAKYVHTNVDGRDIKLSNLDKIIYPNLVVTKAEMIQYYLSIAPIILKYIKDRPLTVIRFPDGVAGKSFYSKDKPKWTPNWIDSMSIQHEEKVIDYVVPTNKASLTWLANLACLELHPVQFVRANGQQPDFFVFDLDPDEDMHFTEVKEAALEVKEVLERFDYTPFLKTSGGKGLHIYVPIIPNTSFEKMFESVKKLARLVVAQNQKKYTLQVSKAKRKGKILIDIYRNHLSNTTVAPFSLRGKYGAPVSMPMRWEDLDKLEKSSKYNIKNFQEYLDQHGDVWADWRSFETMIHDRSSHIVVDENDQRLNSYIEKRDFDKTSEPLAAITRDYTNTYVIQLHDASNLHYDLRLEDDGVLLSWAIPKGMPYRVGQKRLAIRTEDHPIKYLTFEGVIPKGQYGAGRMWVCHTGKIEWYKKTETKLDFGIRGTSDLRRYKLFKTGKDDQWLVQLDEIAPNVFYSKLNEAKPMLASAGKNIPTSPAYSFEVKWDGIRVLIYFEDDQVKIISRGGRDITDKFPELQIPDFVKAEHAVIDAEIVVLDEKGRPKFHDVISRMHKKGVSGIDKLKHSKPVTCYVFDMLSFDGWDITNIPQKRRREWLLTILNNKSFYRYSKDFKDGQQLFEAIDAQGMEGIMAKDQNAKYFPDQRGSQWLKIKCRKTDDCIILGYTKGQGDRTGSLGAIHLGKKIDNQLVYMGKVGTGYDQKMMDYLFQLFSSIEVVDKPIPDKIEEEHRSVWIKQELGCEIKYATLSSNGTYREPVFVKLNE